MDTANGVIDRSCTGSVSAIQVSTVVGLNMLVAQQSANKVDLTQLHSLRTTARSPCPISDVHEQEEVVSVRKTSERIAKMTSSRTIG